ncbi:tRNA pseudouridine(38-40) synthase TruA [Planctomyces sp. SH-PL62]|uniref:tRNA pseudouridine(38-40) synthase TruA n=1 Tax=Planctomyces sp. SH-PL62 TaxID=1636152 RepID=UPI00078C9118|nr:tRNA pseudouridine(38-40) synthase TruA [Planctomyces sp. SH-PL62]AMV40048.1 tRNA pseudouridine synthase A [Planctomyces sp. SH-PL62]
MRNIKLTISYDGTDFHGWQRQPELRTVQSVLDEAIERLNGGKRPNTNASGRTDAGVHALGQVVHFLTAARHRPDVFLKALNAILPPDVRVLAAAEVPQAFHATLDARSKRYRYRIDNGQYASPFELRYAWHIFHRLDVDAMNRAASALLGRHDFRSFETDWPNRLSSVRTIYDVVASRHGDLVHIEVEADGFLYNMVRSIAGTLSLVGTGKRPEGWVGEVLRAENRVEAGPTAPARGLFLHHVNYDRPPEKASRP